MNATALIFAGVGPVLWILYAWLVEREVDCAARARRRRCASGVLTLVTSLWWIAGLEMQGTYGLDILKYTETVQAVAHRVVRPTRSCAASATGSSTAATGSARGSRPRAEYTQHSFVLLAGYGLVVLALLAAGVMRWRHRLFFVLLLLVGVVIAVGRASRTTTRRRSARCSRRSRTVSAAGLALRSTGRAVPLVVLALAVLLGLARRTRVFASAARRRGTRRARARGAGARRACSSS